jgi:tRNA 5-methylaminomethyl-2-thiouridine biosynthesis bifunctional protein
MNPLSLCHARLQSPNIKARFNADVSNIEFENGLWQTFNAAGDRLCEAPVLILANAFESSKFRQSSRLHFKKVRGQVTHVPAEQIPLIQQVVSRDGYLTPSFEGLRSVGATYDFDSDERSLDAESQQKNLARLSSLLNGVMTPSMGLSGRVGFRSLTADRLPVVGMMPDFESVAAPALNNSKILRKSGLYALLGLGSRGAVWSTLAGEILAAMIEGEPAPVSGDLLSAIDPARFLARTKST